MLFGFMVYGLQARCTVKQNLFKYIFYSYKMFYKLYTSTQDFNFYLLQS